MGVERIDLRIGEVEQIGADVLDMLPVGFTVIPDTGAFARADTDALVIPCSSRLGQHFVLDELLNLQVDLGGVLRRPG